MIWNLRGQHGKITNNWIDGGETTQSPQEGIESVGGQDVVISANSVRNIGQSCINLGSAGLADTGTSGIFVENNYMHGCTVGINLGTSQDNGGQSNENTHIRGKVISSIRQYGIDIPVMYGTEERNRDVSGNTIRDVSGAQSAGIMLRSSLGPLDSTSVIATTVERNHIDTVLGPNAQGIRVSGFPNARILNNTITTTSYEAIAIYGSNDVEIAGNRVELPGTIPVGVYSSASGDTSRITIERNWIHWSSPYAGIVLASVKRGAVKANLFVRDDAAVGPSPIVTNSTSCGITLTGTIKWYPGSWVEFATPSCP